jgi:small subunit ribosomal protein S1
VEGKVEAAIKGGFEVRVGKSRAFCPFSQMDLHRVDKPEEYVDRSFFFRVIQYRRGGEDVVVSRRALLEEERGEEAKAVRATLIEGAVMQGHVSSIADFGAFVDLGAGVMGLVHISELSHTRVQRVEDAVKLGDTVPVKILKLDDASGRISLSIRLAQDDPWSGVEGRFEVGKVYPGTVRRLADFGAFVELEAGIEALAPARDFPPSPEGWTQGLEPGCQGQWLVLDLEPGRHRLTVTPAPPEGEAFDPPVIEPGAVCAGKVQKVERFGVFVWLSPGKVGLIPAPWTGVPRGTPLGQRFPVGKDVDVEVVEVSEDGRKIRLGAKGVPREEAAPPPRRESRRASRADGSRERKGEAEAPLSTTFGTSMADALRAALGKREDEE